MMDILGKIKPGYLLDGKYLIKKIVARGAMGAVYKAEVIGTREIVSIKVPLPGFDEETRSRQRFQQAEKIGYQLNHPNIVKVQIPKHEKSFPYVIMEYVDGPSLQYLIEQHRRLSIEDAVNYTVQMCNALDYMRQQNIIHHDIKPSNIIISQEKQLKLTDFGISFSEDLQAEIWASLCSVGGTPAFMAPEKIRSHSVTDYRSDIYSLGILMYNMFTGKLPFTGSVDEIITAQVANDFISPSVLNPQIPPAIEKIILKAMAPNPNERYQDAMSIKYDLEKAMTMGGRAVKIPKVSLPSQFHIPLWVLYIILAAVILTTICVTIYVQMYLVK